MNKVFLFSLFLIGLASFKNDEKIGWELEPGIYILDKQTPVKSLDDLLTLLKDKQIYIDRWATWCGPCLEQFAYKDTLHQFLLKNDILLVYLNSDKDLENEKWFEFIKSHNLKGYHLRLNDELKEDLIKRNIFIPMIPQYMIINKEGIVVNNKALKPSDGVNLFNQLKSLLEI
jgi:thiol-disulfide isomerase/thioredoxin